MIDLYIDGLRYSKIKEESIYKVIERKSYSQRTRSVLLRRAGECKEIVEEESSYELETGPATVLVFRWGFSVGDPVNVRVCHKQVNRGRFACVCREGMRVGGL